MVATNKTRSAEIRARLKHPMIDAVGCALHNLVGLSAE